MVKLSKHKSMQQKASSTVAQVPEGLRDIRIIGHVW